MAKHAVVKSLQQIAEAARHELMLCALALDGALGGGRDLLELRRTVTAPLRHWKLFWARRHRAAARRYIDQLHDALHARASLGVRNPDVWSAITRTVDALSLSRWLSAAGLGPQDVRPSRATVHILLGDLSELLAQLVELEWPNEVPNAGEPRSSS